MPTGTLQIIAQHLVLAVKPLQVALRDLGAFRTLLYRVGWRVESLPPEYEAVAGSVDQALTALENLSAEPSPEQLGALLGQVQEIYRRVKALSVAPAGVDPAAFLSEFGESLFDLLLSEYLNAAFPSLHAALRALDIITQRRIAATAGRPATQVTRVHWDQIPKVLTDPASIPERVYGWGTNDFDFHRLAGHLLQLFFTLHWPAYIGRVDQALAQGFKDAPHDPATSINWGLNLLVFTDSIGGQEIAVGVALLELPAQGPKPPGLILQPLVPSTLGTTFNLTESLRLELRAGTDVATTVGVLLRPDDISVKFPLQPGTNLPNAGFGVTLRYAPNAATLLLGAAGQTRVELKGAATTLSIEVQNGTPEARLEAAPQDLKLIIATGDLDGFLATLLGSGERALPIEVGLKWSSQSGFSFLSGAGLEIITAPHLALGPVRVNELALAIRAVADAAQPPSLTGLATVAIGGTLGPISFALSGMGVRMALTFSDGNAGPFDVQVGFQPPNGIGLELGGGGFSGGGFVKYDPSKGEYAGMLELVFQEKLSIRALAILDTRPPNATAGFSLVLLIAAEFEPIQLSFGFTLLGVGGLLGLNRGASLEALRAGIKDGSLQSILFPVDVVANAPRLIADLARVFPAQPGTFLIGPMAKLGWGTPALVTLELGAVLQLPRPKIAVLGVLRAALPADEDPLVILQVNFIGTLDFAAGQLEFDAALFDSRVLTFTLSGDMAVRAYWKENANLLLSVGGFHPAYSPPPMNLRPMERLALTLFPDNPHVRAEAYFAVTSNTLQAGARLDVSYDFKVFNVSGFLSFDVLIQRSPFHFVADIAAMVAVRTGGHVLFSIQLKLTLEGPAPLHAHGTGSFEIGFIFTITIRVSFDVTLHAIAAAALQPINALAALITELTNPANWRAILPARSGAAVPLAKSARSDASPMLDPAGTLEISQRVLPLNIPVQRIGSAAADSPGVFRIKSASFGSSLVPHSPVQEEFAPGQFFDMSDAEKLSRPSFERCDSGATIGDEIGPTADWMQSRGVAYEVIYLPERLPAPRFRIPDSLARFSRAGGASARSLLSHARRSPSALSARAELQPDRFTVASTDDLTIHNPNLVFDSASAADQALRDLLENRSELQGRLQVVPTAMLSTFDLVA